MENVRVFKPRLRWTMILWIVLLLLTGYYIVECYITGGYCKFKRVWWLVVCVLMIWTGVDELRRRWVIRDGVLEMWSGKKLLQTFSIERMAWVKARRAGYWRDAAPWRTWLVDIGFKDRSQTKSIDPVTVEVKDYNGLIEALRAVNPDIEVRADGKK